jgi:hypothetical protein
MTWPECELITRAEKILEREGTAPPPTGRSAHIKDITIYPGSGGDIYVYRGGNLVAALCNGQVLPGNSREDFSYTLDLFQRYTILEDLADL